ncbi:MAG: HD domain-containing protein [Nanoarchaeota archaeon]|nr:HD domain-containing protein [Nanoarchaeota archaeon]
MKNFIENSKKMVIEKAREFAKEKHKGQTRKFAGEPYFSHLENVSKIVKECAPKESKEEMIAIAFLHDILENTPTTEEELEKNFGKKIASIVRELTTDKIESEKIGKGEYLAKKLSNNRKVSDNTLLIKLADRLDNVSDLHNGKNDFVKAYAKETKHIIDAIEKEREINKIHKELIGKIKEEIEKII